MGSDHLHGHSSPHKRSNKLRKRNSNSPMVKEHKSVVVPARVSSVNAAMKETLSQNSSKDQLGFYDQGSKVQEILGTGDIQIQQHDRNKRGEEKKRGRTSGFMRTSETKSSKKNAGFGPFPTIKEDARESNLNLRVRASSPLLGQEYWSRDSRPPSVPYESGSSSSYYNATPNNGSHPNLSNANKSVPPKANNPPAKQSNVVEPSSGHKDTKDATKESKRKLRPRKLDLSLLFPKPRSAEAPLLSPQRMTDSPSPISVASDHLPTRNSSGQRRSKTPPGSKVAGRKQIDDEPVPPIPSNLKKPDWNKSDWANQRSVNLADASLEKVVGCSEIERALKQYPGPRPLSESNDSTLAGHSSSREPKKTNQSRSAEMAAKRISTHSSVSGQSKETLLSPKSRPHFPRRIPHPGETWNADLRPNFPGDKTSMPKKNSRNTLKNADLHYSSVLCLSSSEDEDEYEEPPKRGLCADDRSRSSVATYDDFELKIRAEAAAPAARRPSVSRLELPTSAGHHGSSRQNQRQSLGRQPSTSSARRSSSTTRKSQSRRSSGIPTISESEILNARSPSQRPLVSSTAKEINRRSRIMAVTREEEHLLEAMRQRRGKITPSLFRETHQKFAEPEQGSMLSLSAPSRDSFYGGDTSFLRLSPGTQPSRPRRAADQGAYNMDKDGYFSPGAPSDIEQKTVHSDGSRRVSLVYSESIPSSSNSGASPLTPVLPIHRFSPLPSPKPPPEQPLPAVPQFQRRHSRRRTDSSEALVLDDADDPEKDEFPTWAYGWCKDLGNLTAVY